MVILAYILSGLSLLMSILFLFRLKFPLGFFTIWIPRLISGALSPYWAIVGIAGAVIGWVNQAIWAVPMGMISAGMMIWYVWQVTRNHDGFEKAFGPGWSDQIKPEQAKNLLKKRWSWFLKMKATMAHIFEPDVPYWTVPETGQELLCDIWRPANGNVSGLSFIYLHGGGWYIGEKDLLTRPFFNHLAAQGHTVMDVSYRLCPKVDIYGMVGDIKHAVSWMKDNASRFGVDPEKVVLGGGSAGGHLALFTGYTSEHPEFTPEDLKNADLSVCGIVSYYGPTDMMAMYQFTGQYRILDLPPLPIGLDSTISRQDFGRLDTLLGGWPQDAPQLYQLCSPATHVHSGSPPTLLFHGNLDSLIPLEGTHALYTKLVESGVPAVKVIYPWTDHAFDLIIPQVNPAAQSALYDVDRFLALLANRV